MRDCTTKKNAVDEICSSGRIPWILNLWGILENPWALLLRIPICKEPKESKVVKEVKESEESKVVKEVKEPKESNEFKEVKEVKESKKIYTVKKIETLPNPSKKVRQTKNDCKCVESSKSWMKKSTKPLKDLSLCPGEEPSFLESFLSSVEQKKGFVRKCETFMVFNPLSTSVLNKGHFFHIS